MKLTSSDKSSRNSREAIRATYGSTLQKLKYDIHTKLPLELYQIRI